MSLVKDIEITSKTLNEKVQSTNVPLIIDVRNSEKYNDWHILNSVNFPIMQLMARNSFSEPDYQNREIILVCTRGKDSLMGAKHLQDNGINAKSLKGGLLEWNNIFDTVPIVDNPDLNIIQFRRISKGCLSYMVFSGSEAVVFDPAHTISPYIKKAEERDLFISKVVDTHLHADHVSGGRELAKKTGAELYLNPNDPFDFEYTAITGIDALTIASKRLIKVVPTPGHTPGSTSYVVKNTGILTGDVLFVDGIGRPDLLDKTKEFAKDLYNSLKTQIASLPNNMFYAPAHHSKFNLEHFNTPIMSDIETFKGNTILDTDEEAFVEYSLEKSKQTKQPDFYETIRLINMGKQHLEPIKINELEIGPNRCAIN